MEAAKLVLTNNFSDYTIPYACYSTLYIADAFLEGDDLLFSKHLSVIAVFVQEFAKPQRVPADFHRFLSEAQELRTTGDYGQLDAATLIKSRTD